MIDSLTFMTSNAFKLGLIVCFVMILNVVFNMLFAKFYRLRIVEIGLFYSNKRHILATKIGHTTLKLGWLPTTTYVKLDTDTTSEENGSLDYKLTSKSTFQRLILSVISSLLLLVFGLIVYLTTNTSGIGSFFTSYINIMFYELSIEDFNAVNMAILNDGSFILCLICVYNFITNLPQLILSLDKLMILYFLGLIIVFFVTLPMYRLLLYHFSFSNLIFYLMGAFSVGGISYFLLKKTQSIVPHY